MIVLEVVDKLKELGGKTSLSLSDKQDIESLYKEVLDKTFVKTSCSDCYRDAVIEMSVYLNKNGCMKEKSNYGLKNGVLLQMSFGDSKFYTNANLTDEAAETYLGKYPGNANYFSKLPKDWKERVEKRLKPKETEYNQVLLDTLVESLKDGVSKEAVVESFKGYQINGKKVTKKLLTAHVSKALDLLEDEAAKENDEHYAQSDNEVHADESEIE